jgi:hypothetical protein
MTGVVVPGKWLGKAQQVGMNSKHGVDAQLHLLQPLDLLDHILSSQLSCARFGLPLCMSFIDTFHIAFAVSIFIAEHYL